MSIVGDLQEWYKCNCNSEMCIGIQISTAECFGWNVSIDLFDTAYEERPLDTVYLQINKNDWFECSKENHIFKGRGGMENLEDILTFFYDWIRLEEN
jgi:hypothetical protein